MDNTVFGLSVALAVFVGGAIGVGLYLCIKGFRRAGAGVRGGAATDQEAGPEPGPAQFLPHRLSGENTAAA
jgi:hypothetical protein